MTQENVLSGLKKDVRSLLVSAKNGLAPEQLKRDYHTMLGSPLPLMPLGFRNVMDMVKEMPDVVSVDFSTGGSVVLKVVGDKTTRGIQQLVAKQRDCKKRPNARKPVFVSHFPRNLQNCPLVLPRRGHAPPALPVQLRSHLRQLLSQGPVTLSELENCFTRRFGRPLQVTRYGFYSIAEMLAAASDLVTIKQSRTGSVVALKTSVSPSTHTVWSAPTPQQSTLSTAKAPVDPGKKGTLSNYSGNKPERPLDSRPSSTLGEERHSKAILPPPKPIQEEKEFETCVKKLEEEFRNGILDSGAAGTVSLDLKEQLRKVVAEKSEGVSVHDLPGEFKRVIGQDLPVSQCGFLSVTEMVSALSDVLYLQPGPEKEANSWIVKSNRRMGAHQGGGQGEDRGAVEKAESLNPSKGGYYFNSGESSWEGEGKGEGEEPSGALEVDSDLKVITKTFSELVDTLPVGGASAVPLDALRGERLKAPTRRRARELAPVLVERVESPSHFYTRFHDTQDARAMENMMIEMRTCYTCPEVAARYRLPETYVRPGQACCLAPRGMWFYRVLIHRVLSDRQVEVYYVDFGDLDLADRSSLRFLKSCYSELPAQAVPSSLIGVRPASGSWSKSAVSYFQKLCCERTLVAAIQGYQGDVLHLFLCDTHTAEDVYVHAALQAEGHALPCTTSYNRMIFGQFNPVTLYMGTGARDEQMLPDPPAMCSLVSNEQSPDRSVQGKPPSQQGSTPMGPSPEGRGKLHPGREEENLPDLPELEFIHIPDVSSPPQQPEKASRFEEPMSKDPEYFGDGEQGWTPGSDSEDTHGPGDMAQPRPGLESSGGENPSCAGRGTETSQHALQPPAVCSEPTPAPSCIGAVSIPALQQQASSFLLPYLHHTSPSLLVPVTHRLRWNPYKMA